MRQGVFVAIASAIGASACVQVLGLDVHFVDTDADTNVAADAPPSTESDGASFEAAAPDGNEDGADASDASDEAPCTDVLTGDVLLCVPRTAELLPSLDASAPFVSGAYTFNASNAQVNPPAGFPATQAVSSELSWDPSELTFTAHMTDPNSVTDDGKPSVEIMACAGDPDSDWNEAECVDFFVAYDNDLEGPERFNPNLAGILHTASGTASDFTIQATIPAENFGSLSAGMHIALQIEAQAYQRQNDSGTGALSSMYAFSINRICHHDAGTEDFSCGGSDEAYEPIRWARTILR